MNLPKAEDLLETLRHEAAELRNFTITFLSLLLYVSLIVAATDHEQILRVSPVNLPLLNVNIPILGFYWFMPPFLFFMHLYILVQHYLFSQLAFRFQDSLSFETQELRNNIRRRLGNLPFLHWLLGKHGLMMQGTMALISVSSLVVWPVFMFWWMQARFLPYHDEDLVLWQQCWLTIDTIFLAYLWAKILDESDSAWNWWKKSFRVFQAPALLLSQLWRFMQALRSSPLSSLDLARTNQSLEILMAGVPKIGLAILLIIAWFFSWTVSFVPDSHQEKKLIKGVEWLESFFESNSKEPHWLLKNVNPSKYDFEERLLFIPTAILHEKPLIQKSDYKELLEIYDPARINEVDCPEKSSQQNDQSPNQKKCYLVDGWMPRNLILRERVLTVDLQLSPELLTKLRAGGGKVTDETLNKVNHIDLQGRNFDYADFSNSSLPRSDLRRTSLKHAYFSNSRLDQADLQYSKLDGANLSKAELPGVNLSEAELPGVILYKAELSGANFIKAKMPGANLFKAKLTGVNLTEAELSGANLYSVELAGADLSSAKLPDAEIIEAKLIGANLSGAILSGTDLSKATMYGANLSKAELFGAKLISTEMPGAILKDIIYEGLSDQEEIKKRIKSFREKLITVPYFKAEKNQKELEKKIIDFRKKLIQKASFSSIKADIPCISNKLENTICIDWESTPKKQQDKVIEFWKTIACRDDSYDHSVAKNILKLKEWPGLTNKFGKLLYDLEFCPGLANLPNNNAE